MVKAEKLDSLDREILNEIQKNVCQPRICILSRNLGKPSTTIYQRLKKLEKAGLITSYCGQVDFRKAGKELIVWMLIALKSKLDFEKTGQILMNIPNIVEVHYISGSYDFLIKARIANTDKYYEFSTKYIQQLPGLIKTEGFITTKSFKEGGSVYL